MGAVILPGGFSYGDYLRCGAIARFAPVMRAVKAFADAGGLVLGICNGFQVLCEAGLLPGALRPNASLSFVCRDVGLVVERADTPFTSRCERGQRLVIPVKHGEGCYVPPPDLPSAQVLLRYAPGENPNGSVDDIAGVVSEDGQRHGPHAPPGARRRLPDRLDGRHSTCSGRSSMPCGHRRRTSVSSGRSRNASRSFSRSRVRNVTGPRRAAPLVA